MRLPALLLLTSALPLAAQDKLERVAADILREGHLLHRLELASWHGTDILAGRHPDMRDRIGGYFSHAHGDSTTCVFHTRGPNAGVLCTLSFNDRPSPEAFRIDLRERPFSVKERDLQHMREQAMARMEQDDRFVAYENTNFNLIPLMDGTRRVVYVLTGPTEEDVVLFGNDYRIDLSRKGRINKVHTLHKDLIPIATSAAVTSMHRHQPGHDPYITPTDLCTLLLYGPYHGWEQHVVLSKDHASLWNARSGQLTIMTRKAWDRSARDHEGPR